MKKILSIIINILLVLIPFLPITENFTSNPVAPAEFGSYLGICVGIFVLMIFLLFILKKDFLIGTYPLKRTAILLFLVGMIVMIPLHLGPPREDETLFEASHVEKTRYALLILAVLILYFAIFLYLKQYWNTLKTSGKLIVLPLILALPILLWDSGDSFFFTEKIRSWVDSGKDSKTFFVEYVVKNVNYYAAGRILLYISIAWLTIILMHHSFIKKWKGNVIGLFCVIGIIFCFLFLNGNPDFYFPFMVPAIVLAPAYWLGLSLFSEKS